MNIYKLLLLPLLIMNSTAFAKCDSYQHLFLIHGIGSSPDTFGKMGETLERHFDCKKTHSYAYATEHPKLSIHDFSKGLNDFINQQQISKNDTVGFIMHSQGGLIGLDWLYQAFHKKSGYRNNRLSQFTHYISASTPFWGSDFSSLGDNFFYSLDGIDQDMIPMGEVQLKDMKYGSQKSLDRLRFINGDDQGFKNFLEEKIKVLNIKASLPRPSKELIDDIAAIFEGDLVVNVPSMEMNVNYFKEEAEDYSSDLVKIERNETLNLKTAYVTGAHTSGTPVPAVVKVPWYCRWKSICSHEGYEAIYRFLSDGSVYQVDSIKNNIRSFEIHVRVKLPKGFEENEDVELSILDEDNEEVVISYYRNDRSDYTPLRFNEDGEVAYFLVKGIVRDSSDPRVEFQITHPQMKTRFYSAPVSKGKVTQLETFLMSK